MIYMTMIMVTIIMQLHNVQPFILLQTLTTTCKSNQSSRGGQKWEPIINETIVAPTKISCGSWLNLAANTTVRGLVACFIALETEQ